MKCRLLRPEVLLAAVLWEDSEAINQAKQLLHNFLNKGQVIPANLREVSNWFFFRNDKLSINVLDVYLIGCVHWCRTVR